MLGEEYISLRTNDEADRMIGRLERHYGVDRAGVIKKGVALLAVGVEAEVAGRELAVVDDREGTRRRIILD